VEIIVPDPFEKLTIETPEQTALEFPLAGLGSRALAFLYDSLIQFVLSLIVILSALYFNPSLGRLWVRAHNWMIAAIIFFFFCLYWGYFAAFEILWHGQTPGKRYTKIRVISSSGRPITAFEGIARNFMRAIDMQFFYLPGVVAVALDKQNRRLGDMVAGTVVVHESEASDTLWYADSSRKPAALHDVASRLSENEFRLIEAFLARRLDLDLELRRKTAAGIAARLSEKLQLNAANRVPDEDFLEDVARLYRDQARLL
jgi:uncharacterized RDD family membrane protein YckC